MKRTIITIAVFAGLAVIVFLFLLNKNYGLNHIFDNWESEVDGNYIYIINDFPYVYDADGVILSDMKTILPDGVFQSVYCMEGDEIFFSYSAKDPETGFRNIWNLASYNVTEKEMKELFSVCLFDGDVKYPTFQDLSRQPDVEDIYGGEYSSGKIYLRGSTTMVFDMLSETSDEINSLPSCRYAWEIEDGRSLRIRDIGNDLSRTVTLESMAKNNEYAKQILELYDRRIWSGESSVYEPFSYVKVVDDQLFIICEVLNWIGESYAVLFEYDILADCVYYVSHIKVGGLVSSNYSFAPVK